uniref:Archease domain-containing protein n=1 Tax=Babesia bovis TaxID=5865 RepID=S6C9Q9_BABBO|nr:conserved hypothetical protein [Babesia bovis]
MESEDKYIIEGVEITSKPCRSRRRGHNPEVTGAQTLYVPDITPPDTPGSDIESEVKELELDHHDYKYLDHPADVILTSHGTGIASALESLVIAMFGYMTDLSLVEPKKRKRIKVVTNSLPRLIFSILDQCLYLNSAYRFLVKYVRINNGIDVHKLLKGDVNVEVEVALYGDTFDHDVHTQGTEIKAATYHGLRAEIMIGPHKIIISDEPLYQQYRDELPAVLEELSSDDFAKADFKLYALVDI